MKRKTMRKCVPAVLIAVWCLLGPAANSAQAYIDPGTGASLFSCLGIMLGIVGTAIAVGFVQIKRCCSWLVALVASRRAPDHADNEGTET